MQICMLIKLLRFFFQEIGMRIVVMNSHEHDVNACYISHLPHLISFP